MKSNLREIFRVYSCGCSKMIIIKINRSTNIRTNKQTDKHFVDPKYLSQIKSDPLDIFRVYSCGCPKKIKIKDKQVNKQTNKQTNRCTFFKILYISAKSSRIFTKFSGYIPV